jgi:chromosome segregation ATPase
MSSTTEIEKTNLEAHTELCAERYDNLKQQLVVIHDRIDSLETSVGEIKSLVTELAQARQSQLLGWGAGIIATLIGAVGFLVWHIITGGKE